MDHDQRFKVLLREFFREFIALFYPQWLAHFDFAQTEWLDKEAFPDPPQGERRVLDLVARLNVRHPPSPGLADAAQWLVLVHIEIEAQDRVEPLRRRIFDYWNMLRHRHGLPVLSIGFYLHVGLEGQGWDEYVETFWDEEQVRFRYPYIGLPALNGEEHLQRDNVLGLALAALMDLPEERRLELGAQALGRLVESKENDYRKHLLYECVMAYLPRDEAESVAFEQRVRQLTESGGPTMPFVTMFDRIRQEGRQEGQRDALLRVLEKKFGPLTEEVRQRVAAVPVERLPEVLEAAAIAHALEDVDLPR